MTPAAILSAPHLRTLVDIGENVPVLMIEPLQFIPIHEHGRGSPKADRGPAPLSPNCGAGRSPKWPERWLQS